MNAEAERKSVVATVPLHVAVGLVRDASRRVLIARRARDSHQGGRWEFPGGKVESGEDVRTALRRELHEEVGILPRRMLPLLRIPHAYPDKRVLLDVWEVTSFSGEAAGREGQPVRWVAADGLSAYTFPDANEAIVRAARLPNRYLVTPEPSPGCEDAWVQRLEERLRDGRIRLVQLRAHGLDTPVHDRLASDCLDLCRGYGAELLLNAAPELARELGAGLHLTAERLRQQGCRPELAPGRLLAASCHNAAGLALARELGVDFCVLGPVQATTSHPGRRPMGLSAFGALIRDLPMPVFALGGMEERHLETARCHRAHGIAAIRGLWFRSHSPDPPTE